MNVNKLMRVKLLYKIVLALLFRGNIGNCHFFNVHLRIIISRYANKKYYLKTKTNANDK